MINVTSPDHSARPPTSFGRPLRRHLLASTALVAVLATSLAACGGGGGSGATAGTTPDPTPTNLPPVDVSAVAANDPGSALPDGWQRGAFMQVFVRSYADSDGDGIGDLRGLTARLDYLRDLGITGLWLMPVQRSQDHDHGYAVSDYRAIETAYGSLADFDELLRQAHARGIGIVIDYVINHSAAENALFAQSRSSAGNPYRSWYLWQDQRPTGWSIYGNNPWYGNPGGWYFAGFWDQMPDFNLLNPAVVAYHHDNLRFWLNRGVDGFRFDAVGNLVENGPGAWENQPQNYTLMAAVRQLVASYQRRWMVCEAPADPLGFAAACGSAFAFGHHSQIIAAARGDSSAVQSVADYFRSAPQGMATMLSNHDSFAGQRPWDQFAGNLAQYRLAAATYLLQPGIPFVYYGEEIGMAGAASLGGDPKLRTPMSWTGNTGNAGFSTATPYRALSANVASANVQAESADPGSLLAFYKALLNLRRQSAALQAGSYEGVTVNGSLMSFQRRLGNERVLVALNYGPGDAGVTFDGLPAGSRHASRWPAGADQTADAGGRISLTVPARSLRVLQSVAP